MATHRFRSPLVIFVFAARWSYATIRSSKKLNSKVFIYKKNFPYKNKGRYHFKTDILRLIVKTSSSTVQKCLVISMFYSCLKILPKAVAGTHFHQLSLNRLSALEIRFSLWITSRNADLGMYLKVTNHSLKQSNAPSCRSSVAYPLIPWFVNAPESSKSASKTSQVL